MMFKQSRDVKQFHTGILAVTHGPIGSFNHRVLSLSSKTYLIVSKSKHLSLNYLNIMSSVTREMTLGDAPSVPSATLCGDRKEDSH